jgi:hypothetical protein
MKFRTAIALLVGCFALSAPLYSSAADDAGLPVEQQLFNDIAVRMQQHLHHTAGLLNKIAQSTDPQERAKLMGEYRDSVRLSMKLDQLMQAVSAAPDMKAGGMMMKGKKMGGMKCSCPMMKMKGKGKAEAGDAGEADEHAAHGGGADEASDDAAGETPDAAAGASGHEGHH